MKMRTQQPQIYETSKSNSMREIHSIADLPQETRKISNKESNFIFKGTRKRTTKCRVEERK